MIPPSTPEFHRDRHDALANRLRSSMHRRPRVATRQLLGSWLVSAGLRLAPDQFRHEVARRIDEHPEGPRASGCVAA